jgi:glycosyltransferase involved in cell wall biosynthesis
MRVALITSNLFADTGGGAEKYVEDAARSLGKEHDVVVLTGSRSDADGLSVRRLPGLPYHDAGSGSAVGRAAWHARDQWSPSVHRALKRQLAVERPDLVWSHEPQGLSAAVFTAVAARELPHVHTAHDLNLLCLRTSMTRDGSFCGGRCLECRVQRQIRGRTASRRLDRLIGVSDYITDRHVSAGIVPAERAVTIRNGAERGTTRIRTPSEQPTVGFIGALAPHKGVLTLLRAARAAPPNWTFLLAGAGPLAGDVESAARAGGRIEWLGRIDGAAKEAFFQRIDVLVVPSEWEEPAPLVAMEAAVRGVPCVVSDRGGLPETPQAQTFRARDAEELLAAVSSFVDTPGKLEQASRRLIEGSDEFTWSTHIGRVEELLRDVVTRAR